MSAQPTLAHAMVRSITNACEFPVKSELSPAESQLVKGCQAILVQGLDLLIRLTERSYSRVVEGAFDASIGQHYRHVLERFQCLIRGIRPGEIDYDARDRNTRISSELGYASVITCEILRATKNWTSETLWRKCRVMTSVYDSDQPYQLNSTVARELVHCTEHAIHHFAVIRLLCGELGVAMAPDFGYAPSTLKFKSQAAAQ